MIKHPLECRFRHIIIAALLVIIPLAATAISSTAPVPKEDDWWQERNTEVNERVKQGNVDMILIGDSITHGFDWEGRPVWEEYYAHRNAVNMGFSGDRTQHVLWRLENGHLDGISPKLAMVMIGTNNHRDNTSEEIAEGVKAIIAKLRATVPDTRILLLAIFPRTDVEEEYQERLRQATELFAGAAEDPMVYFLDINRLFLDRDGELMVEETMPDRLHPNRYGHELWAHAVEPTVARLLGETEWTSLFNGRDLTGWQQIGGAEETWGTENGLLFTDGDGGGWLATCREFGDFELELEFNTPPAGNSGVFIRAPRGGNPAFDGLEVQVLDDYAPEYAELKEWQYCGSVYALIPPAERVSKPAGEWQQMYIRYEGTKIEVKLNGTTIVDDDLENYKEKAPDHPGILQTSGLIGLQNHGSRLDFRNIRIRELPLLGE